MPHVPFVLSKDELRAVGGARKRGNGILRMLADETERTVGRERLVTHAKALHLFALTEANRWDELSNKEKILGIIAVRMLISPIHVRV